MKINRLIDITPDNILEYGICGYKNIKREGFPEKVSWIKENYSKGLRIKSILTPDDGIQGMIEYIPGEYCWRPVNAEGYIFIHCLFSGFRNVHKGKGYGKLLLNACIDDAKQQGKSGVAVVTRKGSFMVGSGIFLKNGFEIVDSAAPDFELLVLRFNSKAQLPGFKKGLEAKIHANGLTVLRADQCPYTVKNVNEIVNTAEELFGIPANVKNLSNDEAQNNPCPFGTFSIIYNGEIISNHPISSTRFVNIMNSLKKGSMINKKYSGDI